MSSTSYAELHCISNFTFLRGASRPEELIETAAQLGYQAIAITDECSMAGIVRAHTQAQKSGIKLIVGTELLLDHGFKLILLARNHHGYTDLCSLITDARRSADKGEYLFERTRLEDIDVNHCVAIIYPADKVNKTASDDMLSWFAGHFKHAWLALTLLHERTDKARLQSIERMARQHQLPVVATGDVHMHCRMRRALQDVVTCIRENCTLSSAGRKLYANGERHLRSIDMLADLYPAAALQETLHIAALCSFSLKELRYEYPHELVPPTRTPISYLRELTYQGMRVRWPNGASDTVQQQIDKELALIEELGYEHYFLTVQDIVRFARENGILCQGRGSAANSAVCFCLMITEVDPMRMSMLFERFISKERNEPPDIDVDFEHERREEVIQYIYNKYGRHRTALAATVISYRRRSAIRDVGKVLGLQEDQIDALAKSMAWWDGTDVMPDRLAEMGFAPDSPLMKRFAWLLEQIMGFPRHLSQHVGGFVISHHPLASLVPVENAAMADRTVIQWDKDDLEELGLLKV
ncbi:MAG: PHP domain-containing protein, partial [Pseudomonadota bacterium]